MMSAFFSKKKIDLGVASSYSFEKELVALQDDARMRALCKPSLYPFLKAKLHRKSFFRFVAKIFLLQCSNNSCVYDC